MYLLADYEQLGWIVAGVIGTVVGACVLASVVVAGILAAVKKDRRHLWWTPVFAVAAFMLFLAGVLVFRGP